VFTLLLLCRVGKTSVVDQCLKPIIGSSAFFCRGKFDLYRRNSAVLVQAFQSILQQIATASPEVLAEWRAKLLASLDGNGALLTHFIPQLEMVIGQQEPLPNLSPLERETVFTATFLRFVGVLAQPQHPLVLFIDDLQVRLHGSVRCCGVPPRCISQPSGVRLYSSGPMRCLFN
jgi:predicted ATPase